MCDHTPGSSARIFKELCAFLQPLQALTRSYIDYPRNGLRPRFNYCHECLTAVGREPPPETFFQLGQCSHCDSIALACDPWLADLFLSLGLRPTGGDDGIPRLRQAFVHTPLIPHAQLLNILSQEMRRRTGRSPEDD